MQDSKDRNESVESISPAPDRGSVEHAAEEGERGRAASGESYEDEADNALLRRKHKQKAVTTDTYDGGNLTPGGRTIEKAKSSKHP